VKGIKNLYLLDGQTLPCRRSAGDLGYSKETYALAEAIGEEIALRGGITVYGAGVLLADIA
jgi:hypothetical protein